MRSAYFLLILCVAFSGCSVGMALKGQKEPDLSVCRIGEDRGAVELQLGKPVNVVTLQNGDVLCEYEYQIGNEKSAGRAAGHAALDVITLGLWEVAGTPIEAAAGKKKRLTIQYRDNCIVTINNVKNAPVQEQTEEEPAS